MLNSVVLADLCKPPALQQYFGTARSVAEKHIVHTLASGHTEPPESAHIAILFNPSPVEPSRVGVAVLAAALSR